MNRKENWTLVETELPDSQRDVLVLLENYPDWSKGVYLANEGVWITPYEDGKVVAWIDAPEIPDHISSPFTFRTASEARYLTAIAKETIEKHKDADKFFFVRSKILEGTTEGLDEIILAKECVTDEIVKELKKAGFTIESLANGSSVGISWK